MRYGVVPPGAEQSDPPVALIRGQGYEVIVARWAGPGEDDGLTVGILAFTP